jgi:serine/threonine-protein kinase
MTGEEGQKVTKTGLVVGTPEYMSPEQLSGDKLDGRSDIYSLALVFYRMLTGTLPFQADSAQETMIKRLTDDPMPLNQAVPGANFPDRLQQVMDKALARMPSERYGSAAEFARDAVQSVAGMKQAAVDTEGATQLISAVPGGAPTAVAGKTQVSGAPLPRARTPDTPAPAAPPPTRPSRAARRPARKTPVAAIAASVAVLAVGGTVAAVMLKGRAAPSPNAADSATTGGAGVTGDTAARVATNNVPIRSGASGSQRTGGAPPTGGTPTGGTGGGPSPGGGGNPPVTQPTRSRVDSAAIDRELLEMIEAATTPATAASARTRAQAIYDDADVPPTLRAAAAFTVAQTFVAEGRNPEACRWNGLALALAPTNPQYLRFKNLASCP